MTSCRRRKRVFVVGFFTLALGFDSCAIYTQEELDAAQWRTNEEGVRFSAQKLNENASKFRKGYFLEKHLDSIAVHEDSIYSRNRAESQRATKRLQEAQEDEDRIRALCCRD